MPVPQALMRLTLFRYFPHRCTIPAPSWRFLLQTSYIPQFHAASHTRRPLNRRHRAACHQPLSSDPASSRAPFNKRLLQASPLRLLLCSRGFIPAGSFQLDGNQRIYQPRNHYDRIRTRAGRARILGSGNLSQGSLYPSPTHHALSRIDQRDKRPMQQARSKSLASRLRF